MVQAPARVRRFHLQEIALAWALAPSDDAVRRRSAGRHPACAERRDLSRRRCADSLNEAHLTLTGEHPCRLTG